MAKLSELMEQYRCIAIKQNPYLNQIVLSFFFPIFSVPRSHPAYHIIYSYLHCFRLWQCFRFSMFWMMLFWGVLGRQWQPTPVLLPGNSHGRRRLVGCSPWGLWGLDTNEWLHFHFSLACIGEGNGNPLQCSCLENPGDRGAWWASVYGVTHSQTRLKWLSSSSSQVLFGMPLNWDISDTLSWLD